MRAERDEGRTNVEGLAAVLDEAQVIQLRVVADRDDQGIVDLVGLCTFGRDIALHQRGAGVLAEAKQRAREHRRRRAAACDMNDVQRLRQHRAVGNLDHDAIGHHRAVERDHRIGIVECEQLRLQRGVARFQHLAQRTNLQALFEAASLGQLWREHAVDQYQTARAFDPVDLERSFGARQRRRIRCRRQRQHFAHQRAQIGVFPVLDPPVRQTALS